MQPLPLLQTSPEIIRLAVDDVRSFPVFASERGGPWRSGYHARSVMSRKGALCGVEFFIHLVVVFGCVCRLSRIIVLHRRSSFFAERRIHA
jgi:hypothetical protein